MARYAYRVPPARGGPRKGPNPVNAQDSENPALAVPLVDRGTAAAPIVFRQGAHPPYGIRWYGITSLYGHFRSFISRWIAAESVDSRDWMRPNVPEELLASMSTLLGGDKGASSLAEALGRPVFIDFIADSGDDRDVSRAVGAMVASTYTHEGRALPRGDVLLFGGDIAYPVATADEIYKRLVLPWNEALRGAPDPKKRVLLAVPGNHDWYDGLDGFGRLFRRRVDEPFRADAHEDDPRIMRKLNRRGGRKLGLVARGLHMDEVGESLGMLSRLVRSISAFARGTVLKRRRRLVLRGYEPFQEASYFAFRLAKDLELWGVDRQLGRVDFRQRTFFKHRRAQSPNARIVFVAADPASAYGERNDAGAKMLAACKLDPAKDALLYLSGDFHHYERRKLGPQTMQVIAGGGGAFLHGTRINEHTKDVGEPEAAYPTRNMSRQLALQAPFKLFAGRSGFSVHTLMMITCVLQLPFAHGGTALTLAGAMAISFGLWLIMYFAGHEGGPSHKVKRAVLALPFAVVLGSLAPTLYALALKTKLAFAAAPVVILLYGFAGAGLFGVYLTLMALLGYEHQQAFTILGHPGFKHFVRLCVHPSGRVEGWTIGKDDALAPGAPALIDHFAWDHPPAPVESASEGEQVLRSEHAEA